MAFWGQAFLGNTLRTWLSAALVTIGVLAGFWILKRFLIKRFYAFAQTTQTDIDDMIAEVSLRTKFSLLALLSLYVGSLLLSLPQLRKHQRDLISRMLKRLFHLRDAQSLGL